MRFPARLEAWYLRNQLGVHITGLIVLLLLIYLIPSIFVTIRSGHAGVKWSWIFGTQVDTVYDEGLHAKLPWNRIYIYDVRLQQHTETYDVLSRDGLRMKVEISVRYRPLESRLGYLHKYVGPDYLKILLLSEIGAHARTQIAQLAPEELYTRRRAEVERAIFRNLVDELEVKFVPRDALLTGEARLRRRILRALDESLAPATLADLARAVGTGPNDLRDDLDILIRAGLVRRVRIAGAGPDEALRYRIDRKVLASSRGLDGLIGRGDPLIYVEDVLIRRIQLPKAIEDAIQRKIAVEEQTKEYDYRLVREQKESERKRIEAEGIRLFQDIVTEGISDRYLKWKGIDATLELAKSPNSKIVVIGGGEDGLPLILGPLDSTGSPEPGRGPRATAPATPAPSPAPAPATPAPNGQIR